MAVVIKRDELFVEPNFLDSDFALRIRRGIRDARQYTTPLQDVEKRVEMKEPPKGRPKSVFDISKELQNELAENISNIKPNIEAFFSLSLGKKKIPYFAIYRTGDFLDIHADAAKSKIPYSKAEWTKIAIVVFLNDQDKTDSPNSFTGGDLNLYGLINHPPLENFGYPIKAEMGKLVAFRSIRIHEVTPVTSGTRYVVNSGYY